VTLRYCPRHGYHQAHRCPACTPRRNGSTRAWRRTRALVLERDSHRCTMVVAGVRCPTTHGLDVHHVIERAAGGSDHPSNLVTLCRQHHQLMRAAPAPRQTVNRGWANARSFFERGGQRTLSKLAAKKTRAVRSDIA
jgi:5-methylcytosine-specific restriction endonuclease McrA